MSLGAIARWILNKVVLSGYMEHTFFDKAEELCKMNLTMLANMGDWFVAGTNAVDLV